MKKTLKYLILIVVSIFVLLFLLMPSFNAGVRDFFVASVLGSQFCPKGDGKTFEDELLVQVNKNVALPNGYIPEDLVEISKEVKATQRICLKKEALDSLKEMFADAQEQNINLAATSAFRSEQVQSKLYKALFALKGEKAKDRIAVPLHSEHQLGTTVDLSGKSINYISANDKFSGTVEDAWLQINAYKYGFILSYPKGKTKITGYDHEPWHYRYLGVEVAKEIFEKQITIEEYFDSLNKED